MSDTLNNTQSACQVPGFAIISASLQILSSWTETLQPRTQEVLFQTQRLQTAQVETQRHQKRGHWVSAQRTRGWDPQTRQRPNTLRQRASKHTKVFKTNKRELHRYFTSGRLTSKTLRTLINLILKPLSRKTEIWVTQKHHTTWR